MQFNIFKKFEKWAKPVVYIAVVVLFVILLLGFLLIDNDDVYTMYCFAAPLLYSIILFLLTIVLEKINSYVDGKLFEREESYQELVRLEKIMNSTINKIETQNLESALSKVIMFQGMTGRGEDMQASKCHGFVYEKGFIFLDEMLVLENKLIDSIRNNKTELAREQLKELMDYYDAVKKEISNNKTRIKKVYGSRLTQLMYREGIVSDIDLRIDDIVLKNDETISNLEDQTSNLDDISNNIRDLLDSVNEFAEKTFSRLNDIEGEIFNLQDSHK